MHKLLAIATIGTLALSSCSVFGTKSAAVSGQLKGFNSDQNLRLALVGFNNGQYTADGSRAQVIDKALTGGYTLTLPREATNGIYRIVVFRDTNNNDRYDVNEAVLSKDNGKRLVKAGSDNATVQGTRYGWNIWDTTNGNIQTTILNNYDLDAQ